MSKNEEKATSEQVEQTASAEAPEAVEEQAVQAGSETAAEPEAQQAEQPGCTHGDPGRSFPEHSQIVVAAPQGLNLREGPHVSYAVKTVLADGAPVEILISRRMWKFGAGAGGNERRYRLGEYQLPQRNGP